MGASFKKPPTLLRSFASSLPLSPSLKILSIFDPDGAEGIGGEGGGDILAAGHDDLAAGEFAEEVGAAAVQLGEDVVKEKDGEIAAGFLPADGAFRQLHGKRDRALLPLRSIQTRGTVVQSQREIVPMHPVQRAAGTDLPRGTLGQKAEIRRRRVRRLFSKASCEMSR